MREAAAYFNLNLTSKEPLVNTFNMILDNQDRLLLNDQNILLPNEWQRPSGFVQKQPPQVFYKKSCS